jgi:hypothetical protein
MSSTDSIQTYNLSEEEEKKEILRHYRGLLKVLKQNIKPGDKMLIRTAFEMAVDAWYKEKDSFVSESGEIESWGGGDKTKMYEEIKTRLQEMKNTDIY